MIKNDRATFDLAQRIYFRKGNTIQLLLHLASYLSLFHIYIILIF